MHRFCTAASHGHRATRELRFAASLVSYRPLVNMCSRRYIRGREEETLSATSAARDAPGLIRAHRQRRPG